MSHAATSPSAQPGAEHTQWWAVTSAAVVLVALMLAASRYGAVKPVLLLIGAGLGFTLYQSAFGFTSAYRRAMVDRDISGVTAQLAMLALAVLLFAPVLADGNVFGHRAGGLVAPVNVSLAIGALLFGVGMQLAGGCASGTLFTVGGGSVRMVIVLVCFCIGCFAGTLHLPWWSELPSAGVITLGREFGWPRAVLIQLAAMLGIYVLLRALGGRNQRALGWEGGFNVQRLLRGPWPLLFGGAMLALLNWAELLVAGHPWSVTGGFTIWAGKAAVALGFDPTTSSYWSVRLGTLDRSLLAHDISLTNFGILVGAFTAAAARGKLRPSFVMPSRAVVSAVCGGLLLGYGARLAYGCNIGAFFGGVVSSSLHGWAWLAAALLGNWLVLRVRRTE